MTSVAFSPDGRQLLTGGTDGSAQLWDAATGKQLRTFPGHSYPITSVAFRSDGRQVLTGSSDETVRLWDVATGDELARLMSLQEGKDWLVVTPEGLFDGSPSGQELGFFRIGDGLTVVPVARFAQDFHRPGLLAALWRGERPKPGVSIGRSFPPAVTISVPGPSEKQTPQITMQVEVEDQGGGIGPIRVLQNGSPVKTEGTSQHEGKTVRQTISLSLVEGENRIAVKSASADGSWESEPAEIVLKYRNGGEGR